MTPIEMISLLGIIAAFILLVVMMMRGVNLFIAALIVVVVSIVTSGLDPYVTFKETYMAGFVDYYGSFFLLFLCGAFLGKIMEVTGAATSIAKWFISIAHGNAWLSVPFASAILAFGGVNAFTTIFATYPVAVEIFKQENISRKLLPATLYFGACTFAMVAPGTPQIQNIVPTQGLGQPLSCGLVSGVAGCITMAILGCLWLRAMIKSSRARGEGFDVLPHESVAAPERLPNPYISIIPLIATLVSINIKINGQAIIPVEAALLLSAVLAMVLLYPYMDFKKLTSYIMDSVTNTNTLIFNTSVIVAFGSVVKMTPGFQVIVDGIINIPGPYVVGAAVGAALICGLCGSASGGLGIATPIFAEIYSKIPGVNMGYIARIMALSSSSLDSMPHSGSIVTVIKLCGSDHKQSYLPCLYLSVIVPAIGTVVGIIVMQLFPTLP